VLSYLLLSFSLCQPAPPKPVPAVVDAPKASITDESGKPFPSTVDGERVLYFYADKANRDPGNEVFWQVWPKSYQKKSKKFPTKLGLMFVVPVGDDKVTLEVYQTVAKTVGKDAQSNTGVITAKVNGGGPEPVPPTPVPPIPVPPIPPEPPPLPPIPTPAKGFRAIFIFESGSNMTRPQLVTLNSTKIAAYLNEKCAKDDKGHADWRRWDKDVDVSKENPTLQQLWAATKPKIDTLPALLIVNDTGGKLMPLPATEAETLAVLKTYGGQ